MVLHGFFFLATRAPWGTESFCDSGDGIGTWPEFLRVAIIFTELLSLQGGLLPSAQEFFLFSNFGLKGNLSLDFYFFQGPKNAKGRLGSWPLEDAKKGGAR